MLNIKYFRAFVIVYIIPEHAFEKGSMILSGMIYFWSVYTFDHGRTGKRIVLVNEPSI